MTNNPELLKKTGTESAAEMQGKQAESGRAEAPKNTQEDIEQTRRKLARATPAPVTRTGTKENNEVQLMMEHLQKLAFMAGMRERLGERGRFEEEIERVLREAQTNGSLRNQKELIKEAQSLVASSRDAGRAKADAAVEALKKIFDESDDWLVDKDVFRQFVPRSREEAEFMRDYFRKKISKEGKSLEEVVRKATGDEKISSCYVPEKVGTVLYKDVPTLQVAAATTGQREHVQSAEALSERRNSLLESVRKLSGEEGALIFYCSDSDLKKEDLKEKLEGVREAIRARLSAEAELLSEYPELHSELQKVRNSATMAGHNKAKELLLAVRKIHTSVTSFTGTDEKAIYDALLNRSSTEIEQMRSLYKSLYGESMDQEVREDLSDREWSVASALLNGRKEEAMAARMFDALKGLGTDEEEVQAALAELSSPEEKKRFIESFDQKYAASFGKPTLRDALKDDLGRVEAAETVTKLYEGDLSASAGVLREKLNGFWGADTRAFCLELEEQLNKVRAEGGTTEKEKDAQVKGYLAKLEGEFQSKYKISFRTYAEKQLEDEKEGKAWAMALMEGRFEAADAHKIRYAIEEPWFKTDKDLVRSALAFKPEAEKALVEALRTAQTEEGKAALREAAAKENEARCRKVSAEYKGSYPETGSNGSLQYDLWDNLNSHEFEISKILWKEGQLKETDRIRDAVVGAGTDEDTVKEILRGRSQEQIARFKAEYKNRWGEDLAGDLDGELSGDDWFDVTEMMRGRPKTMEEAMGGAIRRYDWERGGWRNFASRNFFDGLAFVGLVDDVGSKLDNDMSLIKRAKEAQEKGQTLQVSQAELFAALEHLGMEADTYRVQKNRAGDLAAQTGAVVVGVTVIVVVEVGTMGAATPVVVAVTSTAAAGVSGIAIKAATRGNSYGLEEFGIDSGIVALEVATAGTLAKLSGAIPKGSLETMEKIGIDSSKKYTYKQILAAAREFAGKEGLKEIETKGLKGVMIVKDGVPWGYVVIAKGVASETGMVASTVATQAAGSSVSTHTGTTTPYEPLDVKRGKNNQPVEAVPGWVNNTIDWGTIVKQREGESQAEFQERISKLPQEIKLAVAQAVIAGRTVQNPGATVSLNANTTTNVASVRQPVTVASAVQATVASLLALKDLLARQGGESVADYKNRLRGLGYGDSIVDQLAAGMTDLEPQTTQRERPAIPRRVNRRPPPGQPPLVPPAAPVVSSGGPGNQPGGGDSGPAYQNQQPMAGVAIQSAQVVGASLASNVRGNSMTLGQGNLSREGLLSSNAMSRLNTHQLELARANPNLTEDQIIAMSNKGALGEVVRSNVTPSIIDNLSVRSAAKEELRAASGALDTLVSAREASVRATAAQNAVELKPQADRQGHVSGIFENQAERYAAAARKDSPDEIAVSVSLVDNHAEKAAINLKLSPDALKSAIAAGEISGVKTIDELMHALQNGKVSSETLAKLQGVYGSGSASLTASVDNAKASLQEVVTTIATEEPAPARKVEAIESYGITAERAQRIISEGKIPGIGSVRELEDGLASGRVSMDTLARLRQIVSSEDQAKGTSGFVVRVDAGTSVAVTATSVLHESVRGEVKSAAGRTVGSSVATEVVQARGAIESIIMKEIELSEAATAVVAGQTEVSEERAAREKRKAVMAARRRKEKLHKKEKEELMKKLIKQMLDAAMRRRDEQELQALMWEAEDLIEEEAEEEALATGKEKPLAKKGEKGLEKGANGKSRASIYRELLARVKAADVEMGAEEEKVNLNSSNQAELYRRLKNGEGKVS